MGAQRRMLSSGTIAPLKTSAQLMIQTCSNWAGKVALAVLFRSQAAKLRLIDRLISPGLNSSLASIELCLLTLG